MTMTYKQFLYASLVGAVLFTSCSRPTAYFQQSPIETSRTTQTMPTTTSTLAVALPTEPAAQANTVTSQPDAYARNDGKLVASKKLSKRIDRMKHLLALSSGKLEPATVTAPHKLNLVERAMLRKMNKQIGHRLAPANPEKAMLNKGPLIIGGSVLLVGGLLLLILGSGTGAFIGLIVALVGALGLILGLFGY